jgi:hypothetical protein
MPAEQHGAGVDAAALLLFVLNGSGPFACECGERGDELAPKRSPVGCRYASKEERRDYGPAHC